MYSPLSLETITRTNSFYLTLSSDAPNIMYQSNTTSKFKTELSSPVYLDGNWQIALSEIQYTNNWHLFTAVYSFDVVIHKIIDEDESNSVFASASSASPLEKSTPIEEVDTESSSEGMSPDGNSITISPATRFSLTFHLELRAWRSVLCLCKWLSKELSRQISEIDPTILNTENDPLPIEFSFDSNTDIVSIFTIKSLKVSLTCSHGDQFFRILGFPPSQNGLYHLPMIGVKAANLYQNHLAIFVLCDIVSYQNVGTTQLRLLRSLPIKGRERKYDRVHQYFPKPYYMPVSVNFFKSIEIELQHDNNSPITFPDESKIILTVHLRRTGI